MNALERIKKRLSPVKLYDLGKGTLQYAEISAFAAGLEILDEALDELTRECFGETAESFGIEYMERLWGKVRDDLPLTQRREMLRARNSLRSDDFTLLGIGKIFALLGVEGKISEFPSLHRVVIDITDREYAEGEKNFIRAQSEALLPAHLEKDLVFLGITWKSFEEKAYDFLTFENQGYTWQYIDNL